MERKNELNAYFSIQNLIYGDVFVAYANLSKAELQKVFDELSAEYKGYQAKNLALNMARGKPSAKQLELALGVLEALKARSEFANSNGDDCRNYGLWDGLPEMKRIFADMVGVPASQVILGNNSSLMMMFEVISRGFSHGYNGCTPWCKLDKKKFRKVMKYYFVTLKRYRKMHKEVDKAYYDRRKYLTSYKFWKEYLELEKYQ